MTGDKPLPPIPPPWVPLAKLAWWLQEMHGLTESEIRDVIVDLRGVSLHFRLLDGSPGEKKTPIESWDDLEVENEDWWAGRARWKQCPDRKYFPLAASWEAATRAVDRLRKQRERLALQAPAPGPAEAAGEPKTKAANAGIPQKLPFDARGAKAQLAAKKVGGDWADAPTEKDGKAFLLQLFDTVPRAAHRKIRHELWPNKIRRGPRPK